MYKVVIFEELGDKLLEHVINKWLEEHPDIEIVKQSQSEEIDGDMQNGIYSSTKVIITYK